MNIAAIKKNLATMEGEERKNAESLLRAMGIKFESKPKPSRAAFTSRLSPYVERIDFKCRTCDARWKKYFHYTERVMNSQHVLVSAPINFAAYEGAKVEGIASKLKQTGVPVCKDCTTNLAEWSKDELVATLLNLRLGEEYRRITLSATTTKGGSDGM
jgi:hypothetical protein